MKKIFQYIMLAITTVVVVSCTSDIESTTATIGKSNVQLVVGEFPAFGDSQTRTIGMPDEGKTSWTVGDELLIEMNSKTIGAKYATFTYNGSNWELTSGELAYKEDEVPSFPHVYYAPNYKWESGNLILKEGKVAGTEEYIEGTAQITPDGEAITVSFSNATRNYSRLRIATNIGKPFTGKPITVTVKDFAPANILSYINSTYTLMPDAKGNVYLYGHFSYYSSVAVKFGEYSLADYEFHLNAKAGISYALNAYAIDANNMTATEIENVIKKELTEGKTDIKLILAPNADKEVFDAIRESLKDVKKGTIDLTLIGCEQIPDDALSNRTGKFTALKSISLPNVKKIGKEAFVNCGYLEEIYAPNVSSIQENAFGTCTRLNKVTFGNVTEAKGYDYDGIFAPDVNTQIIDLVLSEEQECMDFSPIGSAIVWKPTGAKYRGSSEFERGYFLNYKFQTVRFL